MSKLAYQAKNASGQVVTGEIEAASTQEAVIRLRAQKLTPIKISMAPKAKAKNAGSDTGFFAKKVNSKELQIFTRQFATLINAGIPVVDALKILSDGLRPGMLKEASANVKSSIESGKRLGEAMALSPNVFDRLYVNMIQAGEEAGILDGILLRLSTYMEKSEKIKGQVKGAMTYPIVILIVAFIVIMGILIFIIPKFQEFFSTAGKEPPMLTQIVVSMSQSLIHNWYIYIPVFVGIPFLLKKYFATPEGKNQLDHILMSTPVVGDLVTKSAIARLTRTLSTLLSSGVGLIEAIEISARTSDNVIIESALMRCRESVTTGKAFAVQLSKEKTFPDMVVQMIAIGEQSGTMDIMLGKIADFYEDEVESAVKGMTSLIEPLMMVFLGSIIAVLVIAMYLPIFGMADTMGG